MVKRVFIITLLMIMLGIDAKAQKIMKAELIFKEVKNVSGEWLLCFADRKAQGYIFSVSRSNTAPYIFYSTSPDGSLKENEKVKDTWFLVSYTVLKTDKTSEKIITQVKLLTGLK